MTSTLLSESNADSVTTQWSINLLQPCASLTKVKVSEFVPNIRISAQIHFVQYRNYVTRDRRAIRARLDQS